MAPRERLCVEPCMTLAADSLNLAEMHAQVSPLLERINPSPRVHTSMIDIGALRRRFQGSLGVLDERKRRLFATNEALALGHGGVTAVSAASGMARSIVNRGIVELKAGGQTPPDGIRRTGSGRKRVSEHQPGLLKGLEELIEGAIRGDQESPLRRVSLGETHLAAVLRLTTLRMQREAGRQIAAQVEIQLSGQSQDPRGFSASRPQCAVRIRQ
jgi:hypothetical protein